MKNKMNTFRVVSHHKSRVLIGTVIEKKREIVAEATDVLESVGTKILRPSRETKTKNEIDRSRAATSYSIE